MTPEEKLNIINRLNALELQQKKNLDELGALRKYLEENPKLVASWQDLNEVSGYYIDSFSKIESYENRPVHDDNRNVFATENQAKSALAKAQLLSTVYTTGITGSTGAGQQLQPTTHFSWRANNISAYKTLNHQHVPEICKSLENLNERKIDLEFVPWRGDFTRGIYTSSTIKTEVAFETIKQLYRNFYEDNSFVFVSENSIDLKQVVNTNKCLLYIEKVDNHVVIHSIIDNLVKGASGQAIQNMNIGNLI